MFYNSNSKQENKNVRLRFRDNTRNILPEHFVSDKNRQKQSLSLSAYHLLSVLGFLLLVGIAVERCTKNLPEPLMLKDIPNHPDRFISERAMSSLIKLTKLGPRVTGSYENEVLAPQLLVKEINEISQNAKSSHKILLDIQKTSGSFPLHFLDGMTHVYKNVQNIVVKLSSQNGSPHSLLMNCHFDTVADSPGGSDDGAGCAIMLEVLRVITQQDEPVEHNIILLFNGAEENLMQASHGFITQHKWANEIRAFINIEACGAGGREILFQAGPNHPWLIETYSDSVPHPYASTLAQEIFESGLIPGDTDFRIFRDFGRVSGLDFAWAYNGYVYHTKYDDVHQIPLGSLQRTGDNILALTLSMSSGDYLPNAEKRAAGNINFFDILGIAVISWSELVGLLINLSTVIVSIYTITKNVKTSLVASNVGRRTYVRQFAVAVGTALASWVLPVLFSLAAALFLSYLSCGMSWFARPVWLVFLYIIPMLFVPMAIILQVSKWQKSVVSSPWTLFQLHCDGFQLLWTVLLIVAIIFKIRSGFIPLIWIVFSCIGNIIRSYILPRIADWKLLVFHVGLLLIPFAQCVYLIMGSVNLYLPIMGRSGAGINSEVVVALLTSSQSVLLFSYLLPLILLVKHPGKVLSTLSSFFVISVLLLLFTPLGFPYSGDPVSPAPQRFMIGHVQRTFHDVSGNVRNHDTGYWIVNMDVNSPQSVIPIIPEMKKAELVATCDTELYCGMPYLIPVLTFIWKTHWIPVPGPEIPVPTTLALVSSEMTSTGVKRLTFNVTGPDHIGLMLSPVPSVTLERWSLVDGEPFPSDYKWNDRETYFVYYSCASDPEPWIFWIELRGPQNLEYSVDLALSSHFLHGKHQRSPQFQKFMAQFPSWTIPTGWGNTHESWKF